MCIGMGMGGGSGAAAAPARSEEEVAAIEAQKAYRRLMDAERYRYGPEQTQGGNGDQPDMRSTMRRLSGATANDNQSPSNPNIANRPLRRVLGA